MRRVASRRYGYTLTDAEAACVAGAIEPALLDALDQATEADPGPGPVVALAQAAARCEPADYLTSQSGLLSEQFGVSDEQATCITHAVDQVAVADRIVAGVLLDTWSALLPGASRDAVITAVATCVDLDLATTILTR